MQPLMTRFRFAILVTIVGSLVLTAATPVLFAQGTQYAKGAVYHDRNGNQKRDPSEPGIPGVRVSNGRDVVQTDARGVYRLPVDDDTILFVIKPRGWRTPLNQDNLARFYYIHKPKGSPPLKYAGIAPTGSLPDSVDFALYPRQEPDRFKVVVFGDIQARTRQEVNYFAHDVVPELVGTEAAFSVHLGDGAFDDPSVFPALNRAIARIGIPWYNAPGNHDENYDVPSDGLALETFRSVYGPPYYSFEYGRVHFVVLDSTIYFGAKPESPRGEYIEGIDPKQMEWLRNDLALVPGGQLVVLLLHSPIVGVGEKVPFRNLPELFRIIEKHRGFSISAHRHFQGGRFITKEDGWEGPESHYHLVQATTCGSWWRGFPDPVGIPPGTMSDGTPKGYSIVSFDGPNYSVRYKVSRRPADYQMNIFAPDEVKAAEMANQEVLVNVFAGTDRSMVQLRLNDGPWVPMERVEREDPYLLLAKKAEVNWNQELSKRYALPKPRLSSHVWRVKLPQNAPKGTHLIHVRTTDRFGQTFESYRVITVS